MAINTTGDNSPTIEAIEKLNFKTESKTSEKSAALKSNRNKKLESKIQQKQKDIDFKKNLTKQFTNYEVTNTGDLDIEMAASGLSKAQSAVNFKQEEPKLTFKPSFD